MNTDYRAAWLRAEEEIRDLEAECARLQQALRDIIYRAENGRREGRPYDIRRIAREALAGPDTPADSLMGHRQKGALTRDQRAELERFADGQPHQLSGSPASGPGKNLIRRNLLTHANLMAGFYRITEYGRALLADAEAADSQPEASGEAGTVTRSAGSEEPT